jgi:hypothetical protein
MPAAVMVDFVDLTADASDEEDVAPPAASAMVSGVADMHEFVMPSAVMNEGVAPSGFIADDDAMDMANESEAAEALCMLANQACLP